MSIQSDIDRGRQASDLLDNPLLKESFDTIEKEIVDQWKSEEDALQREGMWRLLQAARQFKSTLKEVIQTGKLRQKSLDRDRAKLARLGPTKKDY